MNAELGKEESVQDKVSKRVSLNEKIRQSVESKPQSKTSSPVRKEEVSRGYGEQVSEEPTSSSLGGLLEDEDDEDVSVPKPDVFSHLTRGSSNPLGDDAHPSDNVLNELEDEILKDLEDFDKQLDLVKQPDVSSVAVSSSSSVPKKMGLFEDDEEDLDELFGTKSSSSSSNNNKKKSSSLFGQDLDIDAYINQQSSRTGTKKGLFDSD